MLCIPLSQDLQYSPLYNREYVIQFAFHYTIQHTQPELYIQVTSGRRDKHAISICDMVNVQAMPNVTSYGGRVVFVLQQSGWSSMLALMPLHHFTGHFSSSVLHFPISWSFSPTFPSILLLFWPTRSLFTFSAPLSVFKSRASQSLSDFATLPLCQLPLKSRFSFH